MNDAVRKEQSIRLDLVYKELEALSVQYNFKAIVLIEPSVFDTTDNYLLNPKKLRQLSSRDKMDYSPRFGKIKNRHEKFIETQKVAASQKGTRSPIQKCHKPTIDCV